MTEVEQPPQNGIDLSANEEDESSKARPADIEQDMREMERRKRVEAIMGSKLFREELERIVDSARDGGNTAGILQQLSDIVGGPSSRVANVFKASNCMLPINDIRGVESMGYAKGEKILRCKLAATFRLLDLYGWTQGLGAQITARLKVDQEYFLVNPYGLLYHEITASSLNKVDMQGQIVEQGTTNFGVNKSHFVLHSAVHAARPDIRCAIYIGCSPVVAISSLKNGLLPLTKDACVLGDVTTFAYSGCILDEEERNKLVRNLGPNSKVMLLTNHGALCCGETIEEAFFAACHIVQACETQLKLLPVGLDNLVLIPEESRKTIYEQSRRPPEDLEKKFAASAAIGDSNKSEEEPKKDEGAGGETKQKVLGQPPKWRVGGAEFEALMRMLDNAGYRTGYIYRHPLIKSEPPKPKNDVELPPAVSSLGYLLEEEELFRQGIWKKGALAKGGDRSRWLNSPNVYQKVEVLETGTPDPKKITKWVAEGSPTHSTPVRIDDPLQFVPVNTNPKEFKRLQQQIKDNRRADKISAGPQSHILEGVTWDEANRIKDATVSQAGDHVVLMGAASKGIIQRGFQHNATVYKAPYAKNPFDNVTDDELNEYKRTVERKKKSIHGEYTDTDFSESEALSSLQTSGAQQQTKQNTTTTTTTAAVSQSEPEDMSEHQVMRIETQQAPVPSQPEVVLSDDYHIHEFRPSQSLNHPYHHFNLLYTKHQKNYENFQKLQNLKEKYKFLYQPRTENFQNIFNNRYSELNLYMIHKIEIYPHYTYPAVSNVNGTSSTFPEEVRDGPQRFWNTSNQSNANRISVDCESINLTNLPPYRTVSHYGFNYPSTYAPNVHLLPACSMTPVDIQRQKVIAFIKRLNMEAQQAAADSQKLRINNNNRKIKQTGKEEEDGVNENDEGDDEIDHHPHHHIYENTKQLQSAESYISVKEIHLNTAVGGKSKNRKESSSSSVTVNHHHRNKNHHNDNPQQSQVDLLSEQFSSLLSISGCYPAVSNSHTGEHDDHDHFTTTTTDSGDNCLNFDSMRHKTPCDNLYRKYMERRYGNVPAATLEMTTDHSSQYLNQDQEDVIQPPDGEEEEDDPHKPECEQQQKNLHSKINHNKHKALYDDRHVTLTLNSLKRRASALNERKEKSRFRTSTKSTTLLKANATNDPNGEFQNCSSDSNASTAIEIHINVNIRNSDCVKNLQNHENEFKSKLEKVIDNEINLITQELESQENDDANNNNNNHHHNDNDHDDDNDANIFPLSMNNNQLPQRCLSAPEVINAVSCLYNEDSPQQKQQDSACIEADRHFHYHSAGDNIGIDYLNSSASTPLPPPHSMSTLLLNDKSYLYSLRYRHTLALLEHELEMLINGIIRNMCDCKTKISQISDEIRTATLHVGSLSATKSQRNIKQSNGNYRYSHESHHHNNKYHHHSHENHHHHRHHNEDHHYVQSSPE